MSPLYHDVSSVTRCYLRHLIFPLPPLQVADMLPAKKQRYKSTITNLSPEDKTVTLADGSKIKYNKVCEMCAVCDA